MLEIFFLQILKVYFFMHNLLKFTISSKVDERQSSFSVRLANFCLLSVSAPHDNSKPVIRLHSDSMNSSYAKSNADYLEVLQRKYHV